MILKSRIILVIVFITFIFGGNRVKGQITLEHSYNGYTSVANLSVSGYKYYVLDTQNGTLKLYHPDHSIWKSINISVPAGYQLLSTVNNVSENLFSLDDKVGFSYSYYTTTPSYQSEIKVINENGTVLLTVTGANYAYAVEVEGEAKLLAYITNYSTNATTTKVYDLPGNLTTGDDQIYIEPYMPFPNPAQNSIVIPYNPEDMKGGGIIEIFEMSGNCIRQYHIDDYFDHLIIDSSSLPSGTYIYRIKNSSEEKGSGKIVIR